MFSNLNLQSQSNDVKTFIDRFKTEKAVLNEFAKVRPSGGANQFAKSQGISLADYYDLHVKAVARVQDVKAVDFSMTITKKDGVYERKMDACTLFYNNARMQKKVNGYTYAEALNVAANQLGALIDYKDGAPTVMDKVTGLRAQMNYSSAPVAKIVDVLVSGEVKSSEQAVEQIREALVEKKQLVLLEVLAAASPERYKINIDVEGVADPVIGARGVVDIASTISKVVSEGKAPPRVLPVPAALPSLDVDGEMSSDLLRESKSFVNRVSGKCYARNSNVGAFVDNHVYGVEIRKDMAKYVAFLTDCRLTKDVKVVHLFSSDLKYAIGLHNLYPDLDIKVQSGYTVHDYKGKMQPMSRKDMLKTAKHAVGIFIDFKTLNKAPGKDHYEASRLIDADEREECLMYDRYFRYLDYHSVEPDKRLYFLSSYTRDDKVCETNMRTPLYDGNRIIVAFAAVCLHRFSYIWHVSPCFPLLKDYYNDLAGTYNFSVTRSNALDIADSGFIRFLTNDKSPYHGLLCDTVQQYVAAEKRIDVVVVPDKVSNTNNSVAVRQTMFSDVLDDDDEDNGFEGGTGIGTVQGKED